MPITLQEFEARLGRLSSTGKVVGILRPAGIATALDAQGRAQRRVSGPVLSSRTGNLRRSIAGSIKSGGRGELLISLRAGGRVGTKSVSYAASHEFGAEGANAIRPKNAKMLRIPLPAARTGAGVDRMATPLRITAPGQFYLRRSKRGNLILFHAVTKEPWYVLKDKVEIKPRPYLRPSLMEAGKRLPERIAKRVSAALTSAGGV